MSAQAGELLVEPGGDGVLVLRIHNPGRANALDDDLLARIPEALGGPDVAAARAVLLTGSGDRVFSAGVALEPGEPPQQVDQLRRREAALATAAAAIEASPRPVIAVLNGAAMGGALELAAACDWRIASSGAHFAMPPARLGVVYLPEGLRRFVRLVGPAATTEMFLTAKRVDAAEALRIGLVSEVAEPEVLWGRALEVAQAVASLAPLAVAGTRALVRLIASEASPGAVAEAAAEWRERAYASGDLVEGLTAFAERRSPRFEGR